MTFSYELKDFDAGGRIGVMKLGSKILETPNLFPVVSPFENAISPRILYDQFKVQALFTNAYIIYKNIDRNAQILEKGLHTHLDFPGIIATDSGGFQDYMYAGEIKITPEEIEPFQEKLGSDCPVILDIPVQTTDTYEEAKRKVDITLQRAKENVQRRTRQDTAWFGPIHGSIYSDLLKFSSIEMSKLDFGIYAIGGVVKTFMDYRFDLDISILLQVRRHINPLRPLHMFGLGLPNFFALAVACGADTFDSAAYILYARDGRYFSPTGTKNLADMTEFPCNCPICATHTPAEVQKMERPEQIKALAAHNLYYSFAELKTVRQAIREGTLWDLVEQRVHAHPRLIEGLKEANKFPEYFDGMLNLNKTRGLKYLGPQLFYRPEVRLFRSRVQQFKGSAKKAILICLPEMDVPMKSGNSMAHWLKNIRVSKNFSQAQIAIVSNIFGLVPIELADVYPAGQHEGNGDMPSNAPETAVLLSEAKNIIGKHSGQWSRISFLIPSTYINQFDVQEQFQADNNFITHLAAATPAAFSWANSKTYATIEDLVHEL